MCRSELGPPPDRLKLSCYFIARTSTVRLLARPSCCSIDLVRCSDAHPFSVGKPIILETFVLAWHELKHQNTHTGGSLFRTHLVFGHSEREGERTREPQASRLTPAREYALPPGVFLCQYSREAGSFSQSTGWEQVFSRVVPIRLRLGRAGIESSSF